MKRRVQFQRKESFSLLQMHRLEGGRIVFLGRDQTLPGVMAILEEHTIVKGGKNEESNGHAIYTGKTDADAFFFTSEHWFVDRSPSSKILSLQRVHKGGQLHDHVTQALIFLP